MTGPTSANPTINFFTRLRRIDSLKLKPRDLMVLWAISRERGSMGQEVAKKLGYPGRSSIQDGIRRLITGGYIEDRRKILNQNTPSDLHITDAGKALLDEIVPS